MNSSFDKELYRLFILDESPGEKVMSDIAKRLDQLDKLNREQGIQPDDAYVKKQLRQTKSNRNILTVITAAALIIMVIVANSGSVMAAMNKLLAFIPGVGIVEEEKNDILYYMKGKAQSLENEDIKATLSNVYITEQGAWLSLQIDLKGVTEEELFDNSLKEKNEKAAIDILKAKGYEKYFEYKEIEIGYMTSPKISLIIGGKEYIQESGSMGGSFTSYHCSSYYKVELTDWDLSEDYQVKFGDLIFQFQLQDYETYSSAQEIGPTQMHNDISITAIPNWTEDRLKVEFYNMNFSDFDQVYSYQEYSADRNANRPYVRIGDDVVYSEDVNGDGTSVEFDLSGITVTEEMKKQATLHVPIITVLEHENKKIKLSISKNGERIKFPETVEYKHCKMHILDVKKGNEDYLGDEEHLVLSLKFEFPKDNMEFAYFNGMFVNGDGAGGSWEYDKETGIYTICVTGDMPVHKIKTISFNSQVYLIRDEYEFSLE